MKNDINRNTTSTPTSQLVIALVDVLHAYRAHSAAYAIDKRTITAETGLTARDIRRAREMANLAGIAVISAGKGYYLCTDRRALARYIASERRRAMSRLHSLDALEAGRA